MKKGFTLIELLVVIAIIGVLSAVVLASLNSARAKGADSAVKSNLSNARAQAELFYDSNGSQYDDSMTAVKGLCNPAGLQNGVRGIYNNVLAAAKASGLGSVNSSPGVAGSNITATCHSTADRWAAEAPLETGTNQMWCVDYTGFSGKTSGTTLGQPDFNCN